MALTIEISQQTKPGGVASTVVAFTGLLDTATSPQADKELAPVLAAAPPVVEFDLAGLTFISSAGLRVLLGSRKILGAKGAKCYITNAQPQVQKVFEIVKALPGMAVFTSTKELDTYLAEMQRKVIEGE
jgi:anti-anti-sigma factor